MRARLGAGRTGSVYRVRDRVLSEEVALKLLRPELAEDPAALERFRREVKLARKIAHPNVCRVFDLGEADGLAFLTMELLPGETLRTHIARGKGELAERLRLFEQTARGLAAVHAEGILHRDLKPENVLVREDGTAVVSDFGLAIMPDDSKSFITFAGTPLYTSPEQLRCELLDARSDVFALGVVGHELLTGQHPFGGGPPAVVMSAILRDAPATLAMEGVPGPLAADLSDVLLRAMAKDHIDRPSAADVGDSLAALREGIELTPSSPGSTNPTAAPEESTRRDRRKRASSTAARRKQDAAPAKWAIQWIVGLPRSWGRASAVAAVMAVLTAPTWLPYFQGDAVGPLQGNAVAPLPTPSPCVNEYYSAFDAPKGAQIVDFDVCSDCECCDDGLIPKIASEECLTCAMRNALRAAGLSVSAGLSPSYRVDPGQVLDDAPLRHHVLLYSELGNRQISMLLEHPVLFFGLTVRSQNRMGTITLAAHNRRREMLGKVQVEHEPSHVDSHFLGWASCDGQKISYISLSIHPGGHETSKGFQIDHFVLYPPVDGANPTGN